MQNKAQLLFTYEFVLGMSIMIHRTKTHMDKSVFIVGIITFENTKRQDKKFLGACATR